MAGMGISYARAQTWTVYGSAVRLFRWHGYFASSSRCSISITYSKSACRIFTSVALTGYRMALLRWSTTSQDSTA